MPVFLAANNYGKSRVRLVHVMRHGERHDLKDLTVNIQFEGDFAAAHREGDNSKILPTDTMKNTVYALARKQAPEQIEEFACRLVTHFLANNPQVSRVRVEIAEQPWSRISVEGKPHRHAFVSGGSEKRTAAVTGTRGQTTVEAGLDGLLVLKTTASSFEGFLQDRYTTLKETTERIFSTAIRASWVYGRPDVDYGASWQAIRQLILEAFAEHDSRSVQHTVYSIGEVVLDLFEDISEIRLSLPNRHCLLVDLSAFEMDNFNEIFVPVDEPHGLIEAVLKRQSA